MYPLRLSQLRSILIRNLDTRTPTQHSCSVVDCFCELRSAQPDHKLIHQSHRCKETLNPRWFLPQEEYHRLELATAQQFTLHIFATPSTLLLSTTIDVLELVPLNVSSRDIGTFSGLPLNTLLFEACGGGIYALPEVVYTMTDQISMSRVPAMTELKTDILTSSFALRELRKAYAYQRTTDDYRRTAEHAREDVVIVSRKEANDTIVKEELELIMRSISIKKEQAKVQLETKKLKRWERKVDRYEALVMDRAQHVHTIAAHLQQQEEEAEEAEEAEEVTEREKEGKEEGRHQGMHSGSSSGGSGGGSGDTTCEARVLHLESSLHRLEFLVHARQLKLMYELTTIYPIERIQLEASGHATALRHQQQRGNSNEGGRGKFDPITTARSKSKKVQRLGDTYCSNLTF